MNNPEPENSGLTFRHTYSKGDKLVLISLAIFVIYCAVCFGAEFLLDSDAWIYYSRFPSS